MLPKGLLRLRGDSVTLPRPSPPPRMMISNAKDAQRLCFTLVGLPVHRRLVAMTFLKHELEEGAFALHTRSGAVEPGAVALASPSRH